MSTHSEADPNVNEKPAANEGLYRKYDVRRTDGSDAPGGEHHGCRYFVLDLSHDPHSVPALQAYTQSCQADKPALAADLRVYNAGPELLAACKRLHALVSNGFHPEDMAVAIALDEAEHAVAKAEGRA